jgi:tetratricopeptide (TPR) repeat protein
MVLKKAIFILIVLIFSLLYYAGGLTKKETLPFSKEFFSAETSSTGRSWDIKRIAPFSKKELDRLYELNLDKGIRNVPILSFLLIREAEQARRKGDSDEAVGMASYSVKFSPDLPQPYFELARARWHQTPFQPNKILPEVFRGVIAQLRYYPSSLKLFYNVFYILSNAILMAFVIFGIVVMVKYLPLYFSDIRKNLTREISRVLVNSFKVFLLLIPFFLRFDMLWAILFWSVLLWGYVTKRERQFILLFLIVLVYLPFSLRFSSSFLDGPSSDVIVEMNQANREGLDKATEEKLRSWLLAHPEDPDVLFTLGLIEKRQGRYAQAEEFYRRTVQQEPKFSETFSNLGNVYLAQRQTDPAIACYQRAIDLDPDKGAYFYNLYRAYSQETFLSGKAGQAFQRARQLDPNLVDYHSNLDNVNRPSNINRLVIDEVLTPGRLWGRVLTHFIGREGFLFRLFNAWFEKIPSRATFLVPIVFLGFLIGMSRYGRMKRFLTRCPICGSPTYRFYLGDADQEFVCFNCSRLFIQKEKIHPKIAEKKSLQVQEFQKQNHFSGRFLSFFFVGFGYLWRGDFFKGLILLFLFFVFVLRFVYWNGVIPSSLPQPAPAVWGRIFWGGLFVLFYVFSLRRIFRLKPRFETRRD